MENAKAAKAEEEAIEESDFAEDLDGQQYPDD